MHNIMNEFAKKKESGAPRFLPPSYELPRSENSRWGMLQPYPLVEINNGSNPFECVAAAVLSTFVSSVVTLPITNMRDFGAAMHAENTIHPAVHDKFIFSPKVHHMIDILSKTKWLAGYMGSMEATLPIGLAVATHSAASNVAGWLGMNNMGTSLITASAIAVNMTLIMHPVEVVRQSAATHNTTAWKLFTVIAERDKKNPAKLIRKLFMGGSMGLLNRMCFYMPLLCFFDFGKHTDLNFLSSLRWFLYAYVASFMSLCLAYPVGNVQRMLLEANSGLIEYQSERKRGTGQTSATKKAASKRNVLRYASYQELLLELRRTSALSGIWSGFFKTHPWLAAWRGTVILLMSDYCLREWVAYKRPMGADHPEDAARKRLDTAQVWSPL
eukprot:PhM_4_TR3317/c0_g1_i1/m.80362